MQEIFSNTTLTIYQFINEINMGKPDLPELQRLFVWSDSKVRDLFTPLIHGFLIGYLMLPGMSRSGQEYTDRCR